MKVYVLTFKSPTHPEDDRVCGVCSSHEKAEQKMNRLVAVSEEINQKSVHLNMAEAKPQYYDIWEHDLDGGMYDDEDD